MFDTFAANNGVEVSIAKRERLLKIDPSKYQPLVIQIPKQRVRTDPADPRRDIQHYSILHIVSEVLWEPRNRYMHGIRHALPVRKCVPDSLSRLISWVTGGRLGHLLEPLQSNHHG